jgi:hypothetical protein
VHSDKPPVLDYISSAKIRRPWFTPFGFLSLISLCCAIGVLVLSANGYELLVKDLFNDTWSFRVIRPLYDNGLDYCLDPFWIASFFMILPLIWTKRKIVGFFGRRKNSN